MENETEDAMDSELQQKIVDTVKNYMSEAVTLIEGFVSVQINRNDFRHIHISYRELSNELDDNASAFEATPPYLPMPKGDFHLTKRKVSRRKAYMPIKCEGNAEMEEVPQETRYRRRLLYHHEKKQRPRHENHENQKRSHQSPSHQEFQYPQEDHEINLHIPLHQSLSSQTQPQEFDRQPEAFTEIECSTPQQLQSIQSQVQQDFDVQQEISSALPINCLAIDTDPIGPLNAETIQASMNQVMQPTLPIFPLAPYPPDSHVSPLSFNAVIPLPSVVNEPLTSAKPKPRIFQEQRKIKPKPMIIGAQGMKRTNSSIPYTRPLQSMSKRNPNKEFSCNQCQLKFKSLNSLTEHTTTVHLCFRCTTCNSKFTQRSNLQRHSLKHLGFKPFKCAICMKEYYRKDHLVRHVEVSHPGSEPKASIVNVLPSAECLRILEESQSEAMQKKMATGSHDDVTPISTPDTSSDHPKLDDNGPSPADSDLFQSTLCEVPANVSIRNESDMGVIRHDNEMDSDVLFDIEMEGVLVDNLDDEDEELDDLEEDGEGLNGEEKDGEDEEIDEDEDFSLANTELMLPRHLIPFSDPMSASSECPVTGDLST